MIIRTIIMILACSEFMTNINSGSIAAEILIPPSKIPFAKDVRIEKYTRDNTLQLFEYSGKWELQLINDKLTIVGTSEENPAILMSYDKLSKKPKSFKLDFFPDENGSEYGFIYGEVGVVVREKMMYSTSFDHKGNLLGVNSINGKTITQRSNAKMNILEIVTGYDPLGGESQVCIIYINGTGITQNCQNNNNSFGIYLGPGKNITINNIRWGIGSK